MPCAARVISEKAVSLGGAAPFARPISAGYTMLPVFPLSRTGRKVCTKVDGVACKLSSFVEDVQGPLPTGFNAAAAFRRSWYDKWPAIRPISWSFCGSSASVSRAQKINYHQRSPCDAAIAAFECRRPFGHTAARGARPPSRAC